MTHHPLLSDLQRRYDAIIAREPASDEELSESFLSDNVLDSRTDALELRGIPLCGHGGAIRGTRPGDGLRMPRRIQT